MRKIGIYIHVPFCKRKCPYCDFYSVTADEGLIEKYTEAVCRNILTYQNSQILADTVYFGGGTPSLLTDGQVYKILSACDKAFKLDTPEITIEANPSSADFEKLSGYKKSGVNRISFGVQSAVDSELEFLGRLHNFSQAERAVENAVKSGFENISCDIMLGLSGQTEKSLSLTLDRFTSLPIKHISAYMLKIESGTAFDCENVRSRIADDDLMCDFYLQTVEALEGHGFMQYEISNFAQADYESRHNMKYWQCEEYLGFGCSAHSFFKDKRFFCPDKVREFTEKDIQGKSVTETNPDPLEEYVMLGLRLKKGISFDRIRQLSDTDFAESVRKKSLPLLKNGLCKCDGDRLFLTPNGFLISNEVISFILNSQ